MPFPWTLANGTACPVPAAGTALPSAARRGFAAFASSAANWGSCYVRALNLIAVASSYGLVCFTLEKDIPASVRKIMERVNVEMVTLQPFEPRPPPTVRAFARLPKNWKVSYDRLTMFGQEAAYDQLVYLDADLVVVDNIDELVDIGGFDVVLTPETDPCEHAAPQGVNAGVMAFRPSAKLLASLQEFAREMIQAQDWSVFKTSDQSLVAWYMRRYYPGVHAFAARADARLPERNSKLGKERTLFASSAYNMQAGPCACNVTSPETFDNTIWPFIKVWHFTYVKPYASATARPINPETHCFCPLFAQYQRWIDVTQRCSGNLVQMVMDTATRV